MGRFRWIDWPDQFDVRCPRCSGRAVFDYPYLFHPTREGTPDPHGLPLHKWRDWWVTERYPSVMPWSPPKGYIPLGANPWEWTTGHAGAYSYHKLGVVKCVRCHLVAAREVVWPDDAYWRWEIRGARASDRTEPGTTRCSTRGRTWTAPRSCIRWGPGITGREWGGSRKPTRWVRASSRLTGTRTLAAIRRTTLIQLG